MTTKYPHKMGVAVAYAKIADLLLQLKGAGITIDQLADAIARAARETGLIVSSNNS